MRLGAGSNSNGNSNEGTFDELTIKIDPSGTSGNDDDDAFYQLENRWPYVSAKQQLHIQQRFFEDGATIHFERLRGLQSWAAFARMGDPYRVGVVIQKIITAAGRAGRRLTAAEADALSEHANEVTRKLTWTKPAGLVATGLYAFSDSGTFRFPFYQPKMRAFDPFHFPTRSFALLRGARAAATWHFVRFLCYLPLVMIGTGILFTSWSDLSYRARLVRDSRLTALVNDMNSKRKRSHNPEHQRQPNQGAAHDTPPGRQGDYAPRPYSEPRGDQSMLGGDVRNGAAPPPQQPQWGTSQAPPSSQTTGGPKSPAHPPRNADWDSDPFEDDDASPVAPSARYAEAAAAAAAAAATTQGGRVSSGGGSAWARLRQQAQSDASDFARGDSSGGERGWAQLRQDKAPDGKTEGPKGGSREQFSYSQNDKEQAQKEFDALLEAERRGESSKGRR